MFEILKLFADICLFKKGPQDVPYSVWFYRLTIVGYSIVSLLLLNMSMNWRSAVIQLLVEVGLVLLFVGLLLSFSRKLKRYYQTVAALFGTDAMISFCAIPALATMKTGHWPGVTYPVILGLMIWHWAVMGHIFRHSLSVSLSFGLGLAFLFIIGSIQVMTLMF